MRKRVRAGYGHLLIELVVDAVTKLELAVATVDSHGLQQYLAVFQSEDVEQRFDHCRSAKVTEHPE